MFQIRRSIDLIYDGNDILEEIHKLEIDRKKRLVKIFPIIVPYLIDWRQSSPKLKIDQLCFHKGFTSNIKVTSINKSYRFE